MPGAINLPFHAVLDFRTKLMKKPAQLQALFESKGIDLTKPVTASCGSGTVRTGKTNFFTTGLNSCTAEILKRNLQRYRKHTFQ